MPRAAERTLRHRATLRAVVLVATLAVFAGDAAIVRAHGERNAHVRAVIDDAALPAELAGMRIEVHETVGPQLVLANPTAREVEVLDAGGIAFLRIGPAGVEANVAARAWFQTFSPGTPVPIALRSGDR